MSTETKIEALNRRYDAKVVKLTSKHEERMQKYFAIFDKALAKLSERMELDAQYIRDLEGLNTQNENSTDENSTDENTTDTNTGDETL